MLRKLERFKINKAYTNQWILAMWINLPLFTYGLLIGWMSPMTKVLQSHDNPVGVEVTDATITWMASSIGLAAAIITPFYSFVADRFGRRMALILCSLPQAISWILKLTAQSSEQLIIARIFAGISASGCFLIPPMYVKEISDDEIRGTLGSLLTFFQNIGILCMYILGSVLDYHTVLWSVIWLPVLHAILSMKIPESPSYSVKIGETKIACKTIAWLRNLPEFDTKISNYIDRIILDERLFSNVEKISLVSIVSDKAKWKGLLICFTLTFVQAVSGAFAILNYAGTILEKTGMDEKLQTIAIAVVLIAGSFVALSLVEKFGRKILIISSCGLMVISMATLATWFLLEDNGIDSPNCIPILAITLGIFSYEFGASPVPFIVMSEIFSFQLRATFSGVIVTFAWCISFVILFIFTPIVNCLGLHTMFFIFVGINVYGIIFTVFGIPETKGRSLEEIERMLRGK